MKTVGIILISFILLLGCRNQKREEHINKVHSEVVAMKKETPQQITPIKISFEEDTTDKLPQNWSQYYTARAGEQPDWKIVNEQGNKVLAQLSKDNPNRHYNVVVYDKMIGENIDLRVKMKGVAGKMDQGGGFVWRFTDPDNYYVVRANPLEDNVVLYKVKDGKRTDLPVLGKGRTYGVDVKPLGNGWNNLRLTAKDNLFTVYLNSEQLFQVEDETFTNAGKVGLWTKADAVSYFDDFEIKGM